MGITGIFFLITKEAIGNYYLSISTKRYSILFLKIIVPYKYVVFVYSVSLLITRCGAGLKVLNQSSVVQQFSKTIYQPGTPRKVNFYSNIKHTTLL